MDVNSNSHAEPSRADSHVKDSRPGATVSPKEKKVTWQSHVCHAVGQPFFPCSDANTAPALVLLCPLFSLTLNKQTDRQKKLKETQLWV